MGANTGKTGPGFEAVAESGNTKVTKLGVLGGTVASISGLAMSLVAMGIPGKASAQDVQDALVKGDSDAKVVLAAAVRKDGEGTPEDPSAWLNRLDLSNPSVAYFLASRIVDENLAYMRPHLQQFANLDPLDQELVAIADGGIGGTVDEATGDVVDTLTPAQQLLLENLRVSPELLAAIIEEAKAGGASARDIKGLELFLGQLAKNGSLTEARLKFIRQKAPEGYKGIPLVVEIDASVEDLEVAKRLASAMKDLEERVIN